jgi:hypothetical protein
LQTLPYRHSYLTQPRQSFLLSRRCCLHLKLHLQSFLLQCTLAIRRVRLTLVRSKSPIF